MFFRVFLLKVILVFYKHSICSSLSDLSIIESLVITFSRWQSFPSKLEHFLIQKTFRQPPLIMIISNVSNEPLLRWWLSKNLNLKINHWDKRLVFQTVCIYPYSKCYLMLNFICICYLSWNFFYSMDRIIMYHFTFTIAARVHS